MPSLLSMSGVSKSFGATRALADVSFAVERLSGAGVDRRKRRRQVHIDEGVGRSPSAGCGANDRRRAAVCSQQTGRRAAGRRGDDLPGTEPRAHLSVEANILLGQERSRLGWLRKAEQRRIARDALARLSQAELPLDAPVGQLPIAAQQLVEIARALASEAKILVFDEPTSSLTEEDSAHLFAVIGDLRAAGMGIVYISHFLEEVTRVGDVFTVLRDGRSVAEGRLADVTHADLARAMVGREIDELFPKSQHASGPPLLEIRGLCGDPAPRDVDLTLHRGEIFGLAGLVGAGRSELVRAVFGLNEVPHAARPVCSASDRWAAARARASAMDWDWSVKIASRRDSRSIFQSPTI